MGDIVADGGVGCVDEVKVVMVTKCDEGIRPVCVIGVP